MLSVGLLLHILACASSVPLKDFFPFGEGTGDVQIPDKKHVLGDVFNLHSTYSFYNHDYNDLQVSQIRHDLVGLILVICWVSYDLCQLPRYFMLWNPARGISATPS